MRHALNFLKGSLLGVGVLSFIHNGPFTIPEKPQYIATSTPSVTPRPTFAPTPAPVVVKNMQKRKPEVLGSSTNAAIPLAQQTLATYFEKYAAEFNVDQEMLIHIARCESGFRPDAANGPYLGMYQYLASTWFSTRNAMGENPDPSLRTNPEEAIKTTAWKIAHGGIGAWPTCGRRV